MINSILTGLISFIVSCVSLITAPITALIEQYIPTLADVISSINDLINWLIKFVVYVASWLNFGNAFFAFLVASSIFMLLVPLLIHVVKLILRWYRMLMP